MPRDAVLLSEIIEAGERIVAIVGRLDGEQPGADRDLLDALLWNFTVLEDGAAAFDRLRHHGEEQHLTPIEKQPLPS